MRENKLFRILVGSKKKNLETSSGIEELSAKKTGIETLMENRNHNEENHRYNSVQTESNTYRTKELFAKYLTKGLYFVPLTISTDYLNMGVNEKNYQAASTDYVALWLFIGFLVWLFSKGSGGGSNKPKDPPSYDRGTWSNLHTQEDIKRMNDRQRPGKF